MTEAELKEEEERIRNSIRHLRWASLQTDDPVEIEDIGKQIDAKKEQLFPVLKDLEQFEPRGPYSGLTRKELARTGTCEPDWY